MREDTGVHETFDDRIVGEIAGCWFRLRCCVMCELNRVSPLCYTIGRKVFTLDKRDKAHTIASNRFGDPSTARSHSRENAIISPSN